MHRVALSFGTTPGWAYLRELRGDDEEAVVATDSEAAIALLDRLLVPGPGAVVGAGDAAELALPDRDRVLAAICAGELTGKITSAVRCAACDQAYEVEFDLATLVATVDAEPSVGVTAEPGGAFRLADGRRFRLPRGTDERAVAALPPDDAEQALLARCMLDGAPDDAVAEAMRAAGPMLDVEVSAACVECGHAQTARFDVQHYVLAALIGHGRQRALEIHQLAVAYRWSLGEILSLPRARRRIHAHLIEREAAAR